jgi:Right handed beta helix region
MIASRWLVLPLFFASVTALAQAPHPGSMTRMDQIGPRPEPVLLASYSHVRHVSAQAGSDSAPGTAEKPLKSVAGALKSITDSSPSRRYAILVAAGDYPTARLELKANVDLFGGFAADFKTRDVYQHASVLDAGGAGPVLIAADQSRIDGFKLTGGKHDGHGGAIICKGVSPVIANNIITGNRTIHSPVIKPETLHIKAHEGAAIATIDGASPQITNNLIFKNSTDVGDGGAIVVRGGSNPTITKNVIVGNQTGLTDTTMYDGNLGSRSSNGGGISISDTSCPTVSGNIIALNQVHHTNDGGAIYIEYEAMPHIHGNWMVGNVSSDDGGHIYVRGLIDNTPPKGKGPLIEGNIFAGSRVYQVPRNLDRYDEAIFISKSGRARIKGNLFTGQGSAVGVANSIMTLDENVIVNNEGAGVYVDLRVENVPLSTVTGNIIWGNGQGQYTTVRTLSPVPTVTNNIIQGGYEGAGNRGDDPRFIDDSLKLAVTGKTYDASRCLTTIAVNNAPSQNLAGRLINIGRQWSVVRSSSTGQLVVWGEISDGGELFVPGAFQRAK